MKNNKVTELKEMYFGDKIVPDLEIMYVDETEYSDALRECEEWKIRLESGLDSTEKGILDNYIHALISFKELDGFNAFVQGYMMSKI